MQGKQHHALRAAFWRNSLAGAGLSSACRSRWCRLSPRCGSARSEPTRWRGRRCCGGRGPACGPFSSGCVWPVNTRVAVDNTIHAGLSLHTTVSVFRVYSLVGLVVRRPPRERKVPGSNPACDGIFSGSSHTSDLNIGTPVATLPGAWRYRVSTGTGRPGVSILWLGEVERWICNFYLSVAVRKIVWADPSLRYTRMLLGR